MLLFSLVAGAPEAQAGSKYTRYLPAKHGPCSGQNQYRGKERKLKKAMKCLVKKVRRSRGVGGVKAHGKLGRSADKKAADVRRCNSLSHYACGRDAYYWPRRTGYAKGTYRVAENLAWGPKEKGTARTAMRKWLNSDGHRRALFGRSYKDMGVGLARGSFYGRSRSSIWVLHIGCHC